MGIKVNYTPLREQMMINKRIILQRNPDIKGMHAALEFRTRKGNIFKLSDRSSRLMATGDEGLWLAKLEKIELKTDALHQDAQIPKMVEIPGVRAAASPIKVEISVEKISNVDYSAYLDAIGQNSSPELTIDLNPVVLVRWEEIVRDKIEDARLTYCKWLGSLTGHQYGLPTNPLWDYVAKNAKRFGVHDMPGHVMEWVNDEHPKGSGLHVVRGGHLGIAGSAYYPSDYMNIELGFRVVRYR